MSLPSCRGSPSAPAAQFWEQQLLGAVTPVTSPATFPAQGCGSVPPHRAQQRPSARRAPPKCLCAKGSRTQAWGGDDKNPPKCGFAGGEGGGAGELWESESGEHGEGFGDPAGTLAGGLSPQELVAFRSPNRSRKGSWGVGIGCQSKQKLGQVTRYLLLPADPTPPARPGPCPAPSARCVLCPAPQGSARAQQPWKTSAAHSHQFNTGARCGLRTPSAALEPPAALT